MLTRRKVRCDGTGCWLEDGAPLVRFPSGHGLHDREVITVDLEDPSQYDLLDQTAIQVVRRRDDEGLGREQYDPTTPFTPKRTTSSVAGWFYSFLGAKRTK